MGESDHVAGESRTSRGSQPKRARAHWCWVGPIAGSVLGIGLAVPALADVWMVKSPTIGCRERAAVLALHAEGAGKDRKPPSGCVTLYAGERLLEQPEMGRGFDTYGRFERSDSTTVYVRRSEIAADPGIGSVYGDRPE